jgi:FkbM family methyltransferase
MVKFVSDMIFDIGMHKGEDTAFYLGKGFRVIAIEANPDLSLTCRKRFASALQNGSLQIIEGAVAPTSVGESLTFFKNEKSVWGTIDRSWMKRNMELGLSSESIIVPRVDIQSTFTTFGIPYYLKIDIEGADNLVLQGLKEFANRPRFISVEAETTSANKLVKQITILSELGYKYFMLVQQASIPGTKIRTKCLNGDSMDYVFEADASGPFGDELSGPWLTDSAAIRAGKRLSLVYRAFGESAPFRKSIVGRGLRALYKAATGYRGSLPGWHDIHASL